MMILKGPAIFEIQVLTGNYHNNVLAACPKPTGLGISSEQSSYYFLPAGNSPSQEQTNLLIIQFINAPLATLALKRLRVHMLNLKAVGKSHKHTSLSSGITG